MTLYSVCPLYPHSDYVSYSHRLSVLADIAQCVQCRNWSHNDCVGRAANNELRCFQGQIPDWTCWVCALNDADVAHELHAL